MTAVTRSCSVYQRKAGRNVDATHILVGYFERRRDVYIDLAVSLSYMRNECLDHQFHLRKMFGCRVKMLSSL